MKTTVLLIASLAVATVIGYAASMKEKPVRMVGVEKSDRLAWPPKDQARIKPEAQ